MKIEDFKVYLAEQKKVSDNTLLAYVRDIKAFSEYMKEQGSTLERATTTDVTGYVMNLNKSGISKATTNRKLASIRAAYGYLLELGKIKKDPTAGIKTSRPQRKDVDYLTLEEVEQLLSLPDESTKGLRDKAILEVLYGTGMRVMELIELNLSDINTQMGYIQCSGEHGRPRIVPLGKYSKAALNEYIRRSRPALLNAESDADTDDRPLFVNYLGERFTRQGLWKVLSQYGDKIGMKGRITPHILRTSFAVHMIQNGADIKTLQELLGYDDVQAMQVYLQVSSTKIKDVYDKTHPRA